MFTSDALLILNITSDCIIINTQKIKVSQGNIWLKR